MLHKFTFILANLASVAACLWILVTQCKSSSLILSECIDLRTEVA